METYSVQKLEDLFHDRRFFELRDELEKREKDKSPEFLFFRGAVANKFNQTRTSIRLLEKYLKTAQPGGEKLRDCYELLGNNYAKDFQYHRAGETFKWLLDCFGNEYDEEAKQFIEYSYKTWRAASNIPPQTISFSADTRVQGIRTKTNHLEIPVEINGQKANFVFDTGANVSDISVSTARKLGLEIIEADIPVGTSSGIVINAGFAVAPVLQIGGVKLENVIFHVLKDEDIYFEKHDYQMRGIIGYPVIEACRQISINRADKVLIPANIVQRKAEQNLCVDEMMPLVNIRYEGQTMAFILDSGGHKTQFWHKFLNSQKSEIKQKAKPEETEFGGAGGMRKTSVYILDELIMPISGKTVRLKDVKVFTKPHHIMSRNYFGLIGQDFITQFEKMTIDFVSMSVVFE